MSVLRSANWEALELALHNLMELPQDVPRDREEGHLLAIPVGHFLAMDVYQNTSVNDKIRALIEDSIVMDTLRQEVQLIQDPTTNLVDPEGLTILHDRTYKEQPKQEPAVEEPPVNPLDLYLSRYSSLVLVSPEAFQDPRGDIVRIAQIERMAWEWAFETVKLSRENKIKWGVGWAVNTP